MLSQFTNVTDGRTDRQHTIAILATHLRASRGKNTWT